MERAPSAETPKSRSRSTSRGRYRQKQTPEGTDTESTDHSNSDYSPSVRTVSSTEELRKPQTGKNRNNSKGNDKNCAALKKKIAVRNKAATTNMQTCKVVTRPKTAGPGTRKGKVQTTACGANPPQKKKLPKAKRPVSAAAAATGGLCGVAPPTTPHLQRTKKSFKKATNIYCKDQSKDLCYRKRTFDEFTGVDRSLPDTDPRSPRYHCRQGQDGNVNEFTGVDRSPRYYCGQGQDSDDDDGGLGLVGAMPPEVDDYDEMRCRRKQEEDEEEQRCRRGQGNDDDQEKYDDDEESRDRKQGNDDDQRQDDADARAGSKSGLDDDNNGGCHGSNSHDDGRGFYDNYAYQRALSNPRNNYKDRLMLKEGLRIKKVTPGGGARRPGDGASKRFRRRPFSSSFQSDVGARVLNLAQEIACQMHSLESMTSSTDSLAPSADSPSPNRGSKAKLKTKTRTQELRTSSSVVSTRSSTRFLLDLLFGCWQSDAASLRNELDAVSMRSNASTNTSGTLVNIDCGSRAPRMRSDTDRSTNTTPPRTDKGAQTKGPTRPGFSQTYPPPQMRPKKQVSVMRLKSAWSIKGGAATAGNILPKKLIPNERVPALGSANSKQFLLKKVEDSMTALSLPLDYIRVFGEDDLDLVTYSGQFILIGEGTTSVFILGYLKSEKVFVVIKMFKLPFAGGKTQEIIDQSVLMTCVRNTSATPRFCGLTALSPLEANVIGVHDVAMVSKFIGKTPVCDVSTLETLCTKASFLQLAPKASPAQINRQQLDATRILRGVIESMSKLHEGNVVMPGLEPNKILLVDDGKETRALICSRLHTLDDTILALPSIAYLGLKVSRSQSPNWDADVPPESIRRGTYTIKSDVYHLGKVMLEVGHAFNLPHLQELAEMCLRQEPNDRPDIATIRAELDSLIEELKNTFSQPKKPAETTNTPRPDTPRPNTPPNTPRPNTPPNTPRPNTPPNTPQPIKTSTPK